MINQWITLAVFVAGYVLFAILPRRRSIIACACGALFVITGQLGLLQALGETIQWNVIALFGGTLVLGELFMMSRMPAMLAEWLANRMQTVRGAMIMVCLLASVLSMFVENVAVVLLVAPVALSLTEKFKISPVRLLICIALCSNLQGTATLIGDPPSMILAGYAKMTFNDFFVYQGKPGIFFAVQAGMVFSLAVVAWMMRKHRQAVEVVRVEKVRSYVPSVLVISLIVGLALASRFDPDFKWFAGTYTMVLALIGVSWFLLGPRWVSARELAKSIDWDTTVFLVGVFVMVGALTESGWLSRLADAISAAVGSNVLLAYLVIVLVSVVVSAFVDNVPFLLTMIPVAQKVADQTHASASLLLFGLLIGACLGGNMTPIGASANIVSVGILKKRGYHVGFGEFMSVGVPYTIAAVAAAGAFIWFVWGP